MATLIGVVSKVIGEVFAVASDGSRRQLAEGDRVFAGEQLETGASGAVALALANGGELTLGRESSLHLDSSMLAGSGDAGSTANAAEAGTTPPAAPTDQQLTDVEKLQAAIEAGQDPTQQGEATAAGPGAGGAGGGGAGGSRSFVLLTETAGAVDPTIGFPTVGLERGPEFPNPEPAARTIDGEPTAGSTAIALDEDGDLPGSIEGSQYGDDQPGVPASISGNLGYNFGPDGFGSFSWNAVDLSGLSSHGQALVAVISADGLTLTAHRGGVDGPVVFTATTTNPQTGAYTFTLELPLDHPVAGAEDNLNLNLGYTITDGNGTTAGGNLAVSVNDDSPELVSFEGEGEGQGEVFFPHVGFTVHEDALTQAPRGGEDGPQVLALPSVPLNAPYEGNNEDSDPQGADNDPTQTVHAGIEAGPGSLTSLVNFGADGIGSFGLVDTATANSVMSVQNLTSGGVALTYTVTVSGDITTLVASVPGYDVFTLQVGADGSFSFTLQGPLDHPQADGNDGETLGDGELLGIDFTRLLTATDYDGDPVQGFGQATGLFTIDVEDDVPTVGDSKAAVTLDDEGLTGGINGGDGDVAGAAITTSGNLDYAAGADGLKSVSLSGPTTLGTEEVTSTWDASTNTLTISSSRGALVTVELTNLATGAYTVTLLQPLMHGDTTTEDNITLNVGFTVTDGDNDQASGNLAVTINDDSPTIQVADLGGSSFVTFNGTNAGYSNTYGYYVKDADGNPVDGKIIWANVHNQTAGDTVDISGLDPAHTGFFIIPNGATNNAGLSNGAEVTFSLVGGQWVASVGGVALVGSDGANVLFSDAALNPGGSHLQDIGSPGNQNWEDLTNTSDFDYDDVATNVTWGSTVQLQVDETHLDINASANFSGAFNVQPGADGLQSLTYELTVGSNPTTGLLDTATGEDVVLSLTADGVIEGRTAGTGDLVFTLSVSPDGTVTLDQIRAVVHSDTSNPDDVDFLGTGHVNLVATVTDGDGDTATGTLDLGSVISFRDDGPSIVPGSIEGIALVVDESDFGTDASADFSGAFTHSFGNDGAGSITYSLNVSASGGVDSGLVDTASGDAILLFKEGDQIVGRVGDAGGAVSFTVSVDAATGVVTLDQQLAIEHTPDTGPDQLTGSLVANLVQLSATITDKDGDSSTATLNIGASISFHDDAPVITPGEGELPFLQVDETNLGTTDTGDFSGAFASSFGADGAGSITYSLSVSSPDGLDSGLVDTASGNAILLYKEGDEIVGRVGDASGAVSFTVSVDAATGVVTLTQQLAIQHSPDAGPNQPSDNLAANLIQLTGTIIDKDGDTSSATLDIGSQFSFLDDAPSIDVGEGKLASLVVDETDLGTNATADFSGAFSHSYGADGAGTVTYELNVSAPDGVDSGLVDTASGDAILLYKEGNDIVGRVGSDTGAVSFTVSVNAATGVVTLDQILAIAHTPDSGPDQLSDTLAANLIQLTATITDKDGDSDSATLNIGSTISFHDDAPVINPSEGQLPVLQVDETNLGTTDSGDFSGAFTSDFGADGAGSVTYSLDVSASGGVDSGLVDTASGDAIVLFKEGNDIVGRVGGAGGAVSFTVTVNAATGVVTLEQQLAIQHSPDSGPNQVSDSLAANLIQLTGTITDKDGDSSTATLNIGGTISFLDDAPSISVGERAVAGLVVDETTLGTDAHANYSANFVGNYGADGAGSISYSLTSATDGTPSGLVDTASGQAVQLFKEGDDIVGRVGGSGGAISFVVSVDAASGQVTLDQRLAVVHSPDTGPDQATGLASGLIQVTATITDKDGDSSSANLDLGNAISFHDDAPTVGQTTATTVLDDEGLPGGINGGPGDVGGAATSTSGTLNFNAGADGLQSIALSGPTTLGSENVTSVWNASTNTLTISSSRGDLATVTLTNPATGAYTVNLLQPLMHPISGTEDDITLNIGVTVTDKDGDSATGSLTVTVDDDVPTIQAADLGGSSFVTFNGSSAGYNNTYGYYTKDADGNPVDGKIIWANVHSQAPGDTADISGLDPSTTGFFIIPNGASNNAGLTNGATVTFTLVSGQWVASVGGTALVGSAGANVLFTDAALNPGGSHLQDNGTPGNQNWEDLTIGSDYDYNDVATNVTWGSTLQLQVDESNFAYNASANFSGVFNVQPGADGLASQTYSLGVTNAASGLVDTATGEDIVLSVTPAGVIEGRTETSGDLVFTLTVSSTGTVTLDQLRAIVHGDTSNPDDATFLGAGHITLGSTVTDGDGDQATASVDLGQVVSFRDDGPSVSSNSVVLLDDDALPKGIDGGVNDDVNSANTTGTLAHNYGADGAGSIQWLTTGAPAGFSYETSGTTLLVKQGTTTVLTVTLDSTTGEYNVQQNAPIDHAWADNENNQAFTFNYQVSDKDGDTANGTLQVNVDDDTPQAKNDVATVQVSQAQNFNTVFVLDFSGSIDNSELNTMLVAVKAAAQALFNGTTGDVHAQIVVFSGDAASYPTFDNYADFAAKIDALNPATGGTRPFDGNTDFTDAVHKVVTDFTPISGASNQVFFISDGDPTENTGPGGNSLTTAGAAEWSAFISAHNINVTTIGVGNGIDTAHLQQVDLDGSGSPILVGGFDALITTLVNQVTSSFVSGNVLNGSDGVAGTSDDDGWGADGPGHIQSIQINGTTYSWAGSGNITTSAGATIVGSQLTNVVTAEGGKLSFNFSTGAWTYTAPSGGGDAVETFQYSIVDHDGDPSSATLTVYVQDNSPVVAQVEEDELPGGITDGDAFTTVATGSLTDLGVPGSAAQFSLSSNTSGLASATSHGVALVYSVVGNTLTATAGAGGPQVFTLQVDSNGDYTFTLKGPLDHPLANGNDGELLTLDFSSILQATDGTSAIPLTGGFLVNIEDDVPVLVANPQFSAALQVDESFLGTDVTVSFAGAFTGSHGGDGAAAVGGTTYSLSLTGTGVGLNSGLKDTASGSDILLYKVGDTIVGKVGSSSGATAFVVSVDASGNVTLDQQRAIVHGNTSSYDEAASVNSGLINLSSTLTDADGDKASAQIDLGKALSFKDDGPSVTSNATVSLDDDALAKGIAGGVGDDDPNTANTTGTLGHSFGADGAGSVTWLTSGAPAGFTYTTSGTSLLIKQGGTTVVTVTLNTSTGAYTVTQNAAIDHASGNDENNQLFTLNYQVADKDGDKANGTLNINVDDDTPVAKSDVAYVQEAQGQNFNTVFVLDFSGSIDNSELNTMLNAVKTAAQALFSGTSGDVKAQIVVFSSDATSYAPISNYADFAAKVDSLNPSAGGTRPYDGNTDFSDAVSKVISAYTPIPGYSNQVFFISDGNPNENTGAGGVSLTSAVNTTWTNFVTTNNINVTTIGIGDGIDTAHLQQVDVDGSGSPILVANFGSLVSGNVLNGSDGVAGTSDDDGWGADGPGHIQSIQINGTTYSWSGSGNITTSAGATITGSQLTNVVTAEGGKLSFNFSTGAWSYTAPTTVVGDKVETFQYSIVDHDGDPSNATLTVYVEDSAPVVARVEEDELPGGVTDGDAFNTVATGSVSDLLVGPGSATYSLGTNTAGLTAATSHGVGLVYSVSGNTLTATAGAGGAQVFTLQLQSNGNYTFTLKGPLDHPLGNGDDSETLTLNFASILKAVDGSNNALTLAGGFLVQIEDDVPTVSLSNAQVPTLQVDETNLAGNASANFASNFTSQYGADGAGSTAYTLKVSSAGADSGLKDSATGSSILLYQDGNNIVGKVGSASGATAFTLTVNASSGLVTLDQDRAVLHTPNTGANQSVSLASADLVQLVATVKDYDGDSASTTLNLGKSISFLDDAPSAANITQSGQASVSLNTNLLIVLDNSGSMGESSGVGSMSRLDVAKNALLELFEQYDALGDVKVSVVSFSSTATQEEVWVSIADAKAAVLALNATNNTNYDAALISAINAYGEAGKITTGNVQNVAYFLSDGQPNEPSGDAGISSAAGSAAGWPTPYSNGGVSEEQAWINFLSANNVRAYALGMGTGVSVTELNPIAYNGSTGTNTNGQVVSDLSTLTNVLVGTAQASPLLGNLTSGGSFGNDGGYVRALTVDGKTFTYDKTTNALTTTGSGPAGTTGSYASNVITLNLAAGGSLAVNVNTGAYSYTPPSAVSTAIAATILFTLIDLDGDTASAALNLAISASQQPMVIRDDLVLTNLGTQSGNDQISIPTWALLANDTGINHNLLSIIASGSAVDGSVAHTASTVTFTEESSNARDGGSFTYTASIDGSTALDTAVVTVDREQSGENSLDGTFRNEILIGRDGSNDTINGGDGDDILLGLGGNDTLNGGEGNDILAGGTGTNVLNGGNGVDTASYIDAHASVIANLTTGVGTVAAGSGFAATNDSYSNIENLIGSDYNDTLTGNSGSNYLYGGAGNDTINGGGGDDFLIGGLGNDTLTGGAGKDTFIWEKGGLGGTDHITDFTATGGNSDVLDLSQLLSGVAQVGSTLDDYLSFAFSGNTTTIGISTTAGGAVQQTVVLDTVNLSTTYASTNAATVIDGMLNDHTLKTDTV